MDKTRNPDLPGGPIESSNLYGTKMSPDGKQLGTRDLRGDWYSFDDGQTIEFHKIEGVSDRVPIIKLKNGTKLPFETWVSRNKKS